jgi:hypothetical protein
MLPRFMNRRSDFPYAVTELICIILFLVYTWTSDGETNSYFDLQDALKRIIIIIYTRTRPAELWETLLKSVSPSHDQIYHFV